MIIEAAFLAKFNELYPTIELYPVVAPAEVKDTLYAVYKVVGRSSETDLNKNIQMKTCNIQVFFISTLFLDVATATWNFIVDFEAALGIYTTGAPDVQQVQILSSIDGWDSTILTYQSQTEIQIYF